MKKNRLKGGSAPLGRDRFFSVSVKLIPTNENFQLKNICNEMKIKELKSYCEFTTGIPSNVQRLTYLDQGDLIDHLDVRSFDIVPNALLHMDVWTMWRQLIEATATNDVEWVFRLGVTPDSDYKTPNSDFMGANARQQWLADRAMVALYIASHRGHMKLCEKLIRSGANVNGKTPLGRSPLHVAAAKGHGQIVDLLLEKGADINAEDVNGDTALSVASRFGHKGCERHLFLFRWQQRAKQMHPQAPHEMFAHQYFDSAFPVWLKGRHAQVYYTKILPPTEFQGTGFGAPRHKDLHQELSESSDESEEELVWEEEEEEDEGSPSGLEDGRLLRRTRGERPSVKAGMPSIREESGKKTGISSGGRSSQSQQTKPTRGMITNATHKRAKKKGRSKKDSFETWLNRKKAEDRQRINVEKMAKQKKMLAEDDRKRQAEFQGSSYEQWLVDKETTTRKPKAPTGNSPPPGPAKTQPTPSSKPLTTEEIIKKIIERREREAIEKGEEAARVQEDFRFWLHSDNKHLFDHLVSHGPRTVLHMP